MNGSSLRYHGDMSVARLRPLTWPAKSLCALVAASVGAACDRWVADTGEPPEPPSLASAELTIHGEHTDDKLGAIVSPVGSALGTDTHALAASVDRSAGGAPEAVYLFDASLEGEWDASVAGARVLFSDWRGGITSLPSRAGDPSGDGTADLVIGIDRGQSWTDFDGVAALLLIGPFAGDHSANDADVRIMAASEASEDAYQVEILGDTDGDGIDDLAVSAGSWVYVLHGPVTVGATLEDASGHDSLYRGSAVGDLDDDGLQDMAAFCECVHVFHGPLDGLPTEADAVASVSGYCLVGASGDLTGDGDRDLLVSHPYAGWEQEGAAAVFHGDVEGLVAEEQAAAVLTNDGSWDRFGSMVMGQGDLNGDGACDLVAGALDGYVHYYGYFAPTAGSIYLFMGPLEGAYTSGGADIVLTGGGPTGIGGVGALLPGTGNATTHDLAIGGPNTDGRKQNGGAVYVLRGGEDLMDRLLGD
jgi:hypothetical protein